MAETIIKEVKLKLGTEAQFAEKLDSLEVGTLVGTTDLINIGDIDTNTIKQLQLNFLAAAYPVGSIYTSTVATNPNTLFGFGTWEQVKDVFLLAAGSTYAAGTTGGSADAVVVKHNGHLYYNSDWLDHGNGTGYYLDTSKASSYGSVGRGWNLTAGSELYPAAQEIGEDGTGKNMPPYLTVYVWKRTA